MQDGVVARAVQGWVWEANVIRLMRHLSRMVAYEFDDLDQGAVEQGVQGSDADLDRWYAYPLVGERQLNIELAREVEMSPVQVRVSGDLDEVLAARIETAIDLLGEGE